VTRSATYASTTDREETVYRFAHLRSCADPNCPLCGLAAIDTTPAGPGRVGNVIVAGCRAWLATREGRAAAISAARSQRATGADR
jgi:hypothetical protein